MARARNIKPSFFDNDALSENTPLGRLFFVGLWTLVDFNGNAEWRPKRLKAQILPYDNCDLKEIAINLDKSGFVRFYSVQDVIYINVVNFTKHQNPHKNERDKGTEIPGYTEEGRQAVDLTTLTINRDKSRLKRNDSTSDPADSLFLNPDSPSLNPETVTHDPEPKEPNAPKAAWTPPEGLNLEAWELFTAHRKEINKPLKTDRTKTGQANKLKDLTPDQQMAVVNQTLDEGWTGLFPEKITSPQTKPFSQPNQQEGAVFRPYVHEKTERTAPPEGMIDDWRKLL